MLKLVHLPNIAHQIYPLYVFHHIMYTHESTVFNVPITQTLEQFPFGVNEKLNITESVHRIYDGVPIAGNMSACCGYTNQILDQFCASQNTVSSVCSTMTSPAVYHIWL